MGKFDTETSGVVLLIERFVQGAKGMILTMDQRKEIYRTAQQLSVRGQGKGTLEAFISECRDTNIKNVLSEAGNGFARYFSPQDGGAARK